MPKKDTKNIRDDLELEIQKLEEEIENENKLRNKKDRELLKQLDSEISLISDQIERDNKFIEDKARERVITKKQNEAVKKLNKQIKKERDDLEKQLNDKVDSFKQEFLSNDEVFEEILEEVLERVGKKIKTGPERVALPIGPVTPGVPTGGSVGQIIKKSGTNDFETAWEDEASSSGDVVGPASAVDSNFAAFDTTTGKLIKDSGSSASTFATAAQGALADSALQSGDIGTSVQGYDAHLTSIAGLTPGAEGRMITSDGLGTYQISTVAQVRSYLNVENGATADQVASEVPVTPTGNLTSSDVQAGLQELQGDVDTINTTLSQLDSAVILKGNWDASSGSFPGSGSAQAGWSYIVSVGGTVDSVTFAVNDRLIATADNASTTTYASNWFKADYTDQVLSVAGKTGAVTLSVADITDADADLATFSLPANTTISTFGATLVDDVDAATARTTLGVDAAGTDNSTDVTLAGTPDYITISGQVITRNAVDLANDITGNLPVGNLNGGTSASGSTFWRGDGTWATPSATPGADSIGTSELDDGADTPGSGDYVRVDTVDQAGFEYRTPAEVLSDIGAAASSHTHTASDITDFDTEVSNNASVTANTAKVTNATHTGEVTGSGALTLDKTAISNRTDTVITASDYILFGDATDANNLKKDTVQGILDIAGGGSNFASNKFTTATTWAALDSLGGETITQVQVDATSLTGGEIEVQVDGTAVDTIYPGSKWTGIVAPSSDLDFVTQNSTAYNILNMSYASKSTNVTSQESSLRGITIGNSDSKLYVVGTISDSVNQYSITSGDVSTASHDSTTSISTEEINPTGIRFNTDGSKMFISGLSGQDINEYTVTSWDASTRSFVDSYSLSAATSQPTGFDFNNTGEYMYVMDDAIDTLLLYKLSTGYDVSTSSPYQRFYVGFLNTTCRGLAVSPNGKILLLSWPNLDAVAVFVMEEANNLYSAKMVGLVDTSSETTNPDGLAFNSDGTSFYVADFSNDTIYQYNVGTITYAGTAYATINHA